MVVSNSLDCVVLELDGGPKIQQIVAGKNKYKHSRASALMFSSGRICIHNMNSIRVDLENINALSNMSLFFKRYDACLLPIDKSNLAWARQALHLARHTLETPVFGLIDTLTVPATNDLIRSGMADFLYNPLCVDELRIRINKQKQVYANTTLKEEPATQTYVSNDDDNNTSSYDKVCEPVKSYTIGSVPLVTEAEIQTLAYVSAVRSAKENFAFGVAKSRLIGHFERAYIMATLSKTAGNISLAAKGAQKHRRAYWALMRKYDIDAKSFKNNC